MKILIILFANLLVFTASIYAQQRPQFSNYIMNNYLLNPAVAGSYSYTMFELGYRTQWTKIKGAPKTAFLAVHGPINHPDKFKRTIKQKRKIHHGLGFQLYNDQLGALTWFGSVASYSTHIKITKKVTASLGVSMGVKKLKIDGDKLNFVEHEIDNIISPGINSKVQPDGSVGTFIYSDDYFIGFSLDQLFNGAINNNSTSGNNPENKLKLHYYATSGYMFQMSKSLFISPSIMVKYMSTAPIGLDLNIRLLYDNLYWIAVGYRKDAAITFIVEYIHKDQIEISYSYDYSVSKELSQLSRNSHEITVGYRFDKLRGQVLCPRKYW